MTSSKAFLLEPETAPSQPSDKRVYVLANRAGSNVKSAAISVASGGQSELKADLAGRLKLYIKSASGNPDIFIGPSDVTSSTGYLLRAKEELWLDAEPSCQVFAIAASGTADVRVLEVGT